MGRMRFDTLNQPQVGNWEVECAYSAGMEGTPWRSRNTLKDGVFTVEREVADSGSLFIPWQTALLGSTVLSTASLREREEPYHLALELARGTVNRVRSQAADWTQMGLDITRVRRDHPELQMMGGIDKHRLSLGRKAIDRELEKIPFMLESVIISPTCRR